MNKRLMFIRTISTFALVAILATALSCVTNQGEVISDPAKTPETSSAKTSTGRISTSISQKIQNSQYSASILISGQSVKSNKSLPALYQSRSFSPIWSGADGALPQAYEMIEVIKESPAEALNPNDYNLTQIEQVLSRGTNPETMAELDLLLTNAYLNYGHDMLYGRVRPEEINLELMFSETPVSLNELLIKSAAGNNIRESLIGLMPAYPVYAQLRDALVGYREIALSGGWPTVPQGSKLEKGSRGPRVTALRERLKVTGELSPSSADSDIFDEELNQAVLRFQERNGLYVDGVVGKSTIEYLNVPADARVRQIELTMERFRILPRNMGSRFILVNIANYHLYGIYNNRDSTTMRIVVGKPQWNTPIFSEQMTHMVINPYWNIPPSIFKDDIAPRVKTDPNYMSDRNIQAVGLEMPVIEEEVTAPDEEELEVADTMEDEEGTEAEKTEPAEHPLYEEYRSKVLSGKYRLRQQPGPRNPLGRIKFLFPNKHSVYLHDTPNRGYFKRAQRNFSHGCIRVEKPLDLAEFVLYSDPDWSGQRVQSAIYSGKTKTVHLPEPLPVYILYFTAWANPDGSVSFHKDVYGLDSILANALNSKTPYRDMAANIH
jgi:L,D-transpeptidase YcbB